MDICFPVAHVNQQGIRVSSLDGCCRPEADQPFMAFLVMGFPFNGTRTSGSGITLNAALMAGRLVLLQRNQNQWLWNNAGR